MVVIIDMPYSLKVHTYCSYVVRIDILCNKQIKITNVKMDMF